MIVVVMILAVTSAVQFVMLYRLRREMSTVDRVNGRVSRLVESISLLCETTEAGFGVMSDQLTRRVPARRTRARRGEPVPAGMLAGRADHRKAADDGSLRS
jgi:hypothetical protein